MTGATHVFHLAVAMREGGKRDEFFERVNLDGTRRLLEAAVAGRVERFVYCSTIGIYGHRAPGVTREDSPSRPGNIYERTKVAAEAMVREFGAAHRLPVVILRPADVYGPRDQRLLKLFRGVSRGSFPALRPGRRPAAHGLRGRRRLRILHGMRARGSGGAGHDHRGAGDLHPAGADRDGATRGGSAAVRPPAAARADARQWRQWSRTSAACSISTRRSTGGAWTSSGPIRNSTPHARGVLLGWAPTVALEEGVRRTYEDYRRTGLLEDAS